MPTLDRAKAEATLAATFHELWTDERAMERHWTCYALAYSHFMVAHMTALKHWWRGEILGRLCRKAYVRALDEDVAVYCEDEVEKTPADLVIGIPNHNGRHHAPEGKICIPVALTTAHVMFKESSSRAFFDGVMEGNQPNPDKTSLFSEMAIARQRLEKGLARPFAAVALLIVGGSARGEAAQKWANKFNETVNRARGCGKKRKGFKCLVDEPISLVLDPAEMSADTQNAFVHQFLWVTEQKACDTLQHINADQTSSKAGL